MIIAASLALLVFSGDVLDDVWNMAPASAAVHSSDHQKGGAPKSGSPTHDDVAPTADDLTSISLLPPGTVAYGETNEVAPPALPAAIDHPPQLA